MEEILVGICLIIIGVLIGSGIFKIYLMRRQVMNNKVSGIKKGEAKIYEVCIKLCKEKDITLKEDVTIIEMMNLLVNYKKQTIS